MLAFAGKGAPSAPALQSTLDRLDTLQSFGLGGITYSIVFIMVCVVLAFFVATFAVQERVEEKRFLYPHSMLWKVVWLSMSTGTKLVAVSALLPLLRVLAEAFDCDFSAAGDGDGEWPAVPGTPCYGREQLPYLIVALVALILYLPLSFRFLRVHGVLSSIELRRNVLDWRGDNVVTRRRVHALALRSNAYWLMNMLCKTLLTIVGVLLTSEVVAVSVIQLLVGVFLFWWGSKYPPYFLCTWRWACLCVAYS